jgi:hypothetical protein
MQILGHFIWGTLSSGDFGIHSSEDTVLTLLNLLFSQRQPIS